MLVVAVPEVAGHGGDMTKTSSASTRVPVSIQLISGPTVLLEIGGLRLLTDPDVDAPGLVPSGDRALTKTTGPVVAARHPAAQR
jgi:hypothetical protein